MNASCANALAANMEKSPGLGDGRGGSTCTTCGREPEWHFKRWARNRVKNGVLEVDAYAVISASFWVWFHCIYCGVKMDFHAPRPGWTWASLEHKTSRWRGGDNSPKNLFICCHRCNCVKGTADATDYEMFLKIVGGADPELLERLLRGWFDSGKLAQVIERDRAGREDAAAG